MKSSEPCGTLRGWQRSGLWRLAAQAQSDAAAVAAADTAVPTARDAGPDAPRPLPEQKSWRFGVGLGYGERTNPLIQSDDIPVIVDLDIAWFGKRWFFDNGDLGFALFDNERFTTNIVARVNSDRAFFSKTNTRYVNFSLRRRRGSAARRPPTRHRRASDRAPLALKVPKRDYAVELGLEMLLDGEWGQPTLRALPRRERHARGLRDLRATTATASRVADSPSSPSVGRRVQERASSATTTGASTRTKSARRCFGYEADARLQLGSRTARQLLPDEARCGSRCRPTTNGCRTASRDSPIVERPYVLGYFAGVAWQF